MTCVRVRPFGHQKLGPEFYKKESTKPLFTSNDILTVHNLYKYHNTLGMYKILKIRIPISLYTLFKISDRKETLLLSQNSSCTFVDNSTRMWNEFREKLSVYDFMATSIGSLKNRLKRHLLLTQKDHDKKEWCDLNYV